MRCPPRCARAFPRTSSLEGIERVALYLRDGLWLSVVRRPLIVAAPMTFWPVSPSSDRIRERIAISTSSDGTCAALGSRNPGGRPSASLSSAPRPPDLGGQWRRSGVPPRGGRASARDDRGSTRAPPPRVLVPSDEVEIAIRSRIRSDDGDTGQNVI